MKTVKNCKKKVLNHLVKKMCHLKIVFIKKFIYLFKNTLRSRPIAFITLLLFNLLASSIISLFLSSNEFALDV